MAELTVSPLSIVNQIKANLEDRYATGYPILKELLQNADDAGARRIRLDARWGWLEADNPLLREPGFLVVNDGEFRPRDRRGILSFGESVKTADDAAIGKFGFGQKAVFHLCDAFVVHAFDENEHEPFRVVVNPFLNVEAPGSVAHHWDAGPDLRPDELTLSWAVFLPVSDDQKIALAIPPTPNRTRPFANATAAGRFSLLLHGYFFIDSGRRDIEGIREPVAIDTPSNPAELRRAWNAELRDTVVLPLVPVVLRDALDSGVATFDEMERLVAAIATSSWFDRHRAGICKDHALVLSLMGPRKLGWRLAPRGATLRPLPRAVANAPERLEALIPDAHSWALQRNIILCIDQPACLTAEPMRWMPEELDSLLSNLPPRALQSGSAPALLADFLDTAVPAGTESTRYVGATGPHLVRALRDALIDERRPLAQSEVLSRILSKTPKGSLVPLPKSVERRQVLRVLASAQAEVLPIRSEWCSDTSALPLSETDLGAFLHNLEPLLIDDNADLADQAATAALGMLKGHRISTLAVDAELANVQVLRGTDPAGQVVVLSLETLVARAKNGLLFQHSPDAHRLLRTLTDALPGVEATIVAGRTAEILKEQGALDVPLRTAAKNAFFPIINKSTRFGSESARADLLEAMAPSLTDDRQALRRLCTGTPEAGPPNAKLHVLRGLAGVERIVQGVLVHRPNTFLVPAAITAGLAPKLSEHIGITDLDQANIEALFENALDSIARLTLTEPERDAILRLDLSPPYHDEESRLNHQGDLHERQAGGQARIKRDLWDSLCEPDAAADLLSAVRTKIGDLGYSSTRILFELFQNADDAYRQLDEEAEDPRFLVRCLPGDPAGLRVVHWGRPINHLGLDSDAGRRHGRDRDLLNMIVMNFSEKRADHDLTGKFGLGFKSIHLLSDSVGIASGFIALRTRGAFLPDKWSDGIEEARRHDLSSARKATLIDIPFSPRTPADVGEILQPFRRAATWMPAFARRINHITIDGCADPVNVHCITSALPGADSDVDVVAVTGSPAGKQRALRLDLGNGFTLLLKVGHAGACAFEDGLPRIWNLAPLEEALSSDWLLNGPFAVDPGRGRLAGSIQQRQERFKGLGPKLGERLLTLHDLVESDWVRVSKALGLDSAEPSARRRFWSGLFEVMSRDFDDDLAQFLHREGNGYSRLAADRCVVPTDLPKPFDDLVPASEVSHYTDGALAGEGVLDRVRDWPSVASLRGRIVHSKVAGQLRKLDFGGLRPVALSDVLKVETGDQKRIDVDLGSRLGELLTPKSIERAPIVSERESILDVARQTSFRAQDGTWRGVGELSSQHGGGEDEMRYCAFSPESALLHSDYRGVALDFFKVARARSGYGPKASILLKWARYANDKHRQRGVLRYLVDGHQGRSLAEAMRGDRPTWVKRDIERLLRQIVPDWPEEDKKTLLILLGDHDRLVVQPEPKPTILTDAAGSILGKIHDWWRHATDDEARNYAAGVYPETFSASLLRNDDREAWFTMFALACYRTFGRTRDPQHRGFIQHGLRDGWWRQLAESRPPGDFRPWRNSLERWSEPDRDDQAFLLWKRTLVDLYTIARGLDDYILLIRRLPGSLGEGSGSLDSILRPSASPDAARIGADAAPINRSLGIGVNWLVRELVRHGVYRREDESLLAPHCWASTQRVRTFLRHLGADVGDQADITASRVIHDFVLEHIGTDRARFDGDFDLPLQLVTVGRHREMLERWLEEAGIEAPSLRDQPGDGDDDS